MKTLSEPGTAPTTWDRHLPLTRKRRRALLTSILVICDLVAIGAAFWIAYQLRFILLPYASTYSYVDYQRLVFGILPVWLGIFAVFQLYNFNTLLGGLSEYSRVFNAVTIGIFALIMLGFLRRENISISRGWLVFSWILAIFLLIVLRFIVRRLVFALRQRGHLLSPTLIVGANAEGRALAEQLRNSRTSGLFIVGFIDDELPMGASVQNGYTVMGRLDDLEGLVAQDRVEDVIIAPTAVSREQLLNIYQIFNANPQVKLRLSSGLFEVLNTGLRVQELAFVPLIEVNQARITGFDAFLKWVMDYTLTAIALVLLSPIYLLLALAVRLDSPGPVIYRRRVMGANGSQFDAFKFRTMFANGDEILADYPELQAQLDLEHKLKDDPRVTRVGNFLRKWSLDELPQFFNVILGQMSLVGPRMISPPEMDQYGKWGMNLLTVKPGITGQWQVSGRSDVPYEERIRMDMYYIRNWTIWLDIYLLVMTFPAVLKKKGAY
jgi:exopolysaccharide biosynthesis polyprenyl glycosylphosphotransferase